MLTVILNCPTSAARLRVKPIIARFCSRIAMIIRGRLMNPNRIDADNPSPSSHFHSRQDNLWNTENAAFTVVSICSCHSAHVISWKLFLGIAAA